MARAPQVPPNAPSRDGQVSEYRSAEAQALSWFDGARRVIFINGMMNTPADHVTSAVALSLLQGCPVIGVYNRTDGLWLDLGQCLTDKLNMVGPQSGNFRVWAMAVDAAYAVARRARPSVTKVAFVGSLIADNAATQALYDLLTGRTGATMRRTEIFCHSQGNLITSNALTAVALALGPAAIRGMVINSFGSPCRFWPAGLTHTQRAFTFDPVTWLDLRAGFQFDKVGFVAAHSFLTYMRHDGEFTVNRFRWGSFGMTALMDEAGLAAYCARIGNNPTRLKSIFRRLIDAHWSDSDDVAHLYCTRMRRNHTALYQQILRADPEVGRLLVRMLDEGITTSGERTEITFIESVM